MDIDAPTMQKLKEALSSSKNIGIAVAQAPSLDEMAAALAFYLLLKNANKKVSIASVNNPIVEISNLVGINQVQSVLGGSADGDLVVSFPYVDGEIEKVSYTLDEQKGFLNIIVKAGENGLSFSEKDINYTRGSGDIDLLIAIGAAQLADLGEVVPADKLQNVKIVNIDVKQHNQKFGDVVLVSPNRSSVSEHVADITLSLGFQLDQDVAQNLFSGLTSATENFQHPMTSPLAFEIAGVLMKKGARRQVTQPHTQVPGTQDALGGLATRPQPQQQTQSQQSQQRQQTQQPHAAPAVSAPVQNQNQNQNQNRNNARPVSNQQQQPSRPAQQQPAAQNNAQPAANNQEDPNQAPVDWLSPKVYKGSSNF